MTTLTFEKGPVDFATVQKPRSITRVEIAFSPVRTLDGVEVLARLEDVQIHYCRQLADLSALERLPCLRRVNLFSLPNVATLFRIEKLTNLEALAFNAVKILPTIRGIEKLPRLTELSLSRVKVLDGDFAPIIEAESLKRVFWHGAPFGRSALSEIRSARPDMLVGGNAILNPSA